MSKNKKLIIAHGDMDGIACATLQAELLNITKDLMIIFCQPFTVDKIKIPEDVERVYVVDVAVNNRDLQMTENFIEQLGDRLVQWTDHHQGWSKVDDKRFVIHSTAPACAVILGSGMPPRLSHLQQLVSDAIAADTRKGELSSRGQLIEQATKANMTDDSIRVAAVKWLLGDESQKAVLEKAAKSYVEKKKATEELSAIYQVVGRVAIVDTRNSTHEYDLTQLLLAGQKLALFAVARIKNPQSKEERITVATQGGKNLVELFGLPSGAPFRVSLEVSRLPEVLEKLNSEPNSRQCNCGQAGVMEEHSHTEYCG